MVRRNCSSCGLARNLCPPCDGPAGPQGGLQARGSSVAGQQLPAARTLSLPSTYFLGRRQQLPAARTLSLPSTCFLGRHPGVPHDPGRSRSRGGEVRRWACHRRAGGPANQLSPATSADEHGRAGAHRRGVAPGDRVAICSPNTHIWVLAAFGALSVGATLVPVSTRFTGPEALDVITRSGASVRHHLGTRRAPLLQARARYGPVVRPPRGTRRQDRRRAHRRLAPGSPTAGSRGGAWRRAHDGVQVPVPRRPGECEPSQRRKARSAGCGLSARQSSECG